MLDADELLIEPAEEVGEGVGIEAELMHASWRGLAREVVAFIHRLREADLAKVPGVAEKLDWAAALMSLGAHELSPEIIDESLGVVLKYEEDIRRIQGDTARRYLAEAAAGA